MGVMGCCWYHGEVNFFPVGFLCIFLDELVVAHFPSQSSIHLLSDTMTNSNKRLTVFQTNDYSTSMRKFFCPESYTSYSSSSSSSPCNFDAYAAKSIVTALAFEEDSMGSSSNRYSHQKTQHETKSRNPLTEQGESYYDCLEYAEDDASDHVQYDIGRLPLLLRGGSMMSNLAWTLTSTPTISDLESAASTGSTPPKQNQQPPTSYNSPPVESFRPPPPMELPDRFLRAGKMDPSEGRRRYEATLAWRREQRMDFVRQTIVIYFNKNGCLFYPLYILTCTLSLFFSTIDPQRTISKL